MEGESVLATELTRARANAGLTQKQLAERMGTKQEVIARWERGKVMPSTRTLARLAEATGTKLQISFAPLNAARAGRQVVDDEAATIGMGSKK